MRDRGKTRDKLVPIHLFPMDTIHILPLIYPRINITKTSTPPHPHTQKEKKKKERKKKEKKKKKIMCYIRHSCNKKFTLSFICSLFLTYTEDPNSTNHLISVPQIKVTNLISGKFCSYYT